MIAHWNDCLEETLENGVKRRIIGSIDDLMAVELVWKKGMVGAVHSHPHRQLGYVVKGSFEGEIGGEKAVFTRGDCYYTEKDQPHGLVALEDDSVLLDVFTPMRQDFAEQLQATLAASLAQQKG